MAALATRAGVTGRTITIDAPLLRLSKAEIIRSTRARSPRITRCHDRKKEAAPWDGAADRLRALGFA